MPTPPQRKESWGAEGAPFMLMNIVPNHMKPQERWSDAPGFKGARLYDLPPDEHGRVLTGMQFYLDPEKHIERTSSYEGSTDRRDPQTGITQPARDVWIDKRKVASKPAGSLDEDGLPIHGAGIVEGLEKGESIRDPARLIIEPKRFGHRSGNQPVQHEGHHRIAGAAVWQKKQREAGVKDWSVPVPFELHFSLEDSNKAERAMKGRLDRDRHTGMSNAIVKHAYGGPKY